MTLSILILFSIISVLLLSPSIEVFPPTHTSYSIFQIYDFFLVFFFFYPQFLCQYFLMFALVSRVFIIALWSICMIATLKYLSGNSNISAISMLISLDCIFLCKFWLSWLLVRRVIIYCTMDILGIALWDSGSYIIFSLAGNNVGYIGVGWAWRFNSSLVPADTSVRWGETRVLNSLAWQSLIQSCCCWKRVEG